eukprot:TRINITY_DN5645_c0_g1_i1.p2 TRINITY_DN5645_c0_g1~~TRINITY_DN5645_c0_g1_i1.p2  ORF type:complete len:277 (+),score=66.69 TRINITY_DN5645_c0_g1_i1:103-933(+)
MKKNLLALFVVSTLFGFCNSAKFVKKRLSPRDYTDNLHYPTPVFDYDQITKGACVLYFIGLLYMFLGIKQLHQLYLKPCLDLFRITNTFDEDTMASTVEPIAITATETFISFFATFLGVTDVGISAFLGSNAFTACVERGIMILFAGPYGEIDWYVSLRDMTTYAICLLAIGLLISNGTITTTNAILMLMIFFVYWVFMQYNSKIENYARKSVRLRKLYRILPRLKDEQIEEKHKIERRALEYLPEYYLDSDYVVTDGWLQINSLGTVCILTWQAK